jgi:predicted ATPase
MSPNSQLGEKIASSNSELFQSFRQSARQTALARDRERARTVNPVGGFFRLGLWGDTHLNSGSYATASAQADELVALADEKGSLFWKAFGMALQGCVLALIDDASNAVQLITSARTAYRSTGGRMMMPWLSSNLARAHVELGQFDDAWRCITEAMTAGETTKEKWFDAEIHRTAGEILLMSPEPDAAKTEACFERALTIAREQEARSWELRAAMSMARLWRDQGKLKEARDLLVPVDGWFTEGFDTLDLKEAKGLLDALAS